MVPAARAAAAHQVNGGIMGEPDEESPLVADAGEQVRLPGEFYKNVLQEVVCVVLVPRQTQQEAEQSLGVVVIKSLQIKVCRHRFHLIDASRRRICLAY